MRPFILFVALLLSVCSCRKTSKGFNEKLIIDPIEGPTKELVFHTITIRPMQCSDCELITAVEKNGSNITLNITGISIPRGCNSNPSSAYANSTLGVLINGTYTLTINNGNKQSTGKLTVTDDTYTLSFDKLNDIDLPHDKLRRVPENTIWGEVLCPDSSRAGIAGIFTDSLLYSGATTFFLPEGHYTHFEISNGNIAIETPFATSYFKYRQDFFYKYTGDTKKLDTLVTWFGKRDSAYRTVFSISTSKGELYQYPSMAVY